MSLPRPAGDPVAGGPVNWPRHAARLEELHQPGAADRRAGSRTAVSTISGALDSDDTRYMVAALRQLGDPRSMPTGTAIASSGSTGQAGRPAEGAEYLPRQLRHLDALSDGACDAGPW